MFAVNTTQVKSSCKSFQQAVTLPIQFASVSVFAYILLVVFPPDSEYGFAEKVVEGMSVVINSITIKVQAQAFHASFELWQLQGNSLNPKWQRSDLRYTRITDPKRGEVTSGRAGCVSAFAVVRVGRSCTAGGRAQIFRFSLSLFFFYKPTSQS